MPQTDTIICDIDGCLLDSNWIWKDIQKLGLKDEGAFEYFNSHIADRQSQPIKEICELLRKFDNRATIVFFTARCEHLRKYTWENVTIALGTFPDAIFMRPKNNKDEPTVLKENFLKKLDSIFNVILAIDDNPDVCKMYERHRIPTINYKFNEI